MSDLYLTDSYIKTLNTKIDEVKIINKKAKISLRDNIFYPGGGGQPLDIGSIYLEDGSIIPITNLIKMDRKGLEEFQFGINKEIVLLDESFQLMMNVSIA